MLVGSAFDPDSSPASTPLHPTAPAFPFLYILCLRSCRLPSVFIRRPCLPSLPEELRNSWVPSLPGSYPSSSLLRTLPPPSRHPSSSRFQPVIGRTCSRVFSLWDEEGFSSCSTCPCHRAVPTTPPKCHAASVSPRHVMPPSPRTRGLGLRIFSFFFEATCGFTFVVGIELRRADVKVKGYQSHPFGCEMGSQFHQHHVSRGPPIIPDGRVSQVRFGILAFLHGSFQLSEV